MCVSGQLFATPVLSGIQLFATPGTVAYQAPLFMGFSRQEYWSWLPFPTPADLLDPGIKPTSPVLSGEFFTTVPPGKPLPAKYWLKNYVHPYSRI